jgi:hypothetical protein
MNNSTASTERIVAAWLKWGTLASAAICLAGLAVLLAGPAGPGTSATAGMTRCPWPCDEIPGGRIIMAGVASLLAVSIGRLALLAGLFLHQGDRAFAAISTAGFLLTIAAACLAALSG